MKNQRILYSPLILILIVGFFFACGGGGSGPPPPPIEPPPIEAGTWRGPSDFGEIEFVVTPDGKGIEEVTLYFLDYSCGIVTSNLTETIVYSPTPLEILSGEFMVEESGLDKITIQGSFNSSETASGNFTADYDVNTTTCSGNWSASPSNIRSSSLKIDDTYLQYRNYGNPTSNRYATWIGITVDGEPIQSTEAVGFEIRDSTGSVVSPTNPQFYRSSPYYFYNCIANPCTEQANNIYSGYSANFSDLSAGDYQIEVEAADGQKITKDITYPGQLIIPGVDIATMNSQFSNGDLVLNWTNPTGDSNWDEVDQLRIVLTATDGAEVLYISTNPTAESETIPESLVTKVNNLGHGTMDLWEIQTRAYDENGMNFARGYSHIN